LATHYEVLGVSQGASNQEVRRAYHRQARRLHPDLNPGGAGPATTAAPDGGAGDAMAAVNRAWSVLGDPSRRREYDSELRALAGRPAPEPTTPVAPDDDDLDTAGWWDEPEERDRVAELVVLVPVALLGLAVATFAFSMVAMSGALLTFSFLLVPVAALAFLAAPLVVLRRRARARRLRL